MSPGTPRPELTQDERKAIAALKRVAAKWPKTLWLFVGDGCNVMKTGPNGEQMHLGKFGGTDPAFKVDSINIPCDGGDW